MSDLSRRQITRMLPPSGENERAFAWLEEAYKERSNILQFVKVHPLFDPLRGDPRFVDLVHSVGLG